MMVALIQDLKTTEGTDLRYINCKNAGKNDALNRLRKQKGMSVNFEFTMPSTLEINGRV